jgi:hypothetical protein
MQMPVNLTTSIAVKIEDYGFGVLNSSFHAKVVIQIYLLNSIL